MWSYIRGGESSGQTDAAVETVVAIGDYVRTQAGGNSAAACRIVAAMCVGTGAVVMDHIPASADSVVACMIVFLEAFPISQISGAC